MAESNWLASEMSRLRITQKEIAQLLGIDPSRASRLLAGERKITDEEFDALKAYFQKVEMGKAVSPAGQRLKEALFITRLSPDELSESTSVPTERIAAALDGDDLSVADAEAIAKHLRVPYLWLLGHDVPKEIHRRLREFRTGSAPRTVVRRGTIPIYASPVLIGGSLVCEFAIAEQRPAPAALDLVEGAFGIFVGDGPYGQRFRSGDVIFLHPSKPVLRGHDVFAVLEDEQTIIVGIVEARDQANVVIRVGTAEIGLETSGIRLHKIVGAWWD